MNAHLLLLRLLLLQVLLFYPSTSSLPLAHPAAEPTSRPPPLATMSFNIRYANPGDEEYIWPRRRPHVCSLIPFHGAHIAGLQEVLSSQLRDLVGTRQGGAPPGGDGGEGGGGGGGKGGGEGGCLPRYYHHVGAGRDDGREGGEMAPILYDTRRLRLVDSGTWWLSETPTQAGSKGWDASSPRIVTWAMLEDRVAGERGGEEGQGGRARRYHRWLVLNTHFDHIGTGTSTCTAERESLFEYSVRAVGLFWLPELCSERFEHRPIDANDKGHRAKRRGRRQAAMEK